MIETLSQSPAPALSTRATTYRKRIESRLAMLKSILAVNPNMTQRQLQRLLQERGVKTSKGTLMNDLSLIGKCTAPSAYSFRCL